MPRFSFLVDLHVLNYKTIQSVTPYLVVKWSGDKCWRLTIIICGADSQAIQQESPEEGASL